MKEKNLTRGSIKKHLVTLAFPLIIGNILQQTYNTIDAFVVGRYAGQYEFSAIGVASSLMNLLTFAIVGGCTGIAIIFSGFYGAGQKEEFRREHFTAMVVGGAFAAFLCIGANLLLAPVLRLTRTPAEIFGFTEGYLRVVLLGLPFVFLYNLYHALLRSTGNTRVTLFILLLSVLCNLGLDFLLVGVAGMGSLGAAWATLFSQGVSAVAGMLAFRKILPGLMFGRADCRWDRELVLKTVRFSAVTGVHQASIYIGKLMVQSVINAAGTEMIAAYTAATRIEGYANSFGDSGAAAISVLAAQNLGAGKQDRVARSHRDSLQILAIVGVVCAVVLYVTADTTVGFILGAQSGAAYDYAVSYLHMISVFYIFCFTGNAFAGFLNGTGRVTYPFIGAVGHISLRVILSWIFVGKYGLEAVAVATGIGWICVNVFWWAVGDGPLRSMALGINR